MIECNKLEKAILFSRVGNEVVDQVPLRGTVSMYRMYPALETPGYFQLSLPGQKALYTSSEHWKNPKNSGLGSVLAVATSSDRIRHNKVPEGPLRIARRFQRRVKV